MHNVNISLTPSLTHLLTHPPTYPPTLPLTHSLTHTIYQGFPNELKRKPVVSFTINYLWNYPDSERREIKKHDFEKFFRFSNF